MITKITYANQQPNKSFKAGGAIQGYERCSSGLKSLLHRTTDFRLHRVPDVAIFRTPDDELQQRILRLANEEGIINFPKEFPSGSLKDVNVHLLAPDKT